LPSPSSPSSLSSASPSSHSPHKLSAAQLYLQELDDGDEEQAKISSALQLPSQTSPGLRRGLALAKVGSLFSKVGKGMGKGVESLFTPSVRSPATSANNKATPDDLALPPSEPWLCTNCTFENSAFMSACEMCDHAAPEWPCSNCTFLNPFSTTTCQACSAPRPPLIHSVPPPTLASAPLPALNFVPPSALASTPLPVLASRAADDSRHFEHCANYEKVWDNAHKASKTVASVTVWRPLTPPGFVFFGYLCCKGDRPPSVSTLIARDHPAFRAPQGFSRLVRCRDKKGMQGWLPIPPPGFIALGHIVTPTTAPPKDPQMRCVHSSVLQFFPCLEAGEAGCDGMEGLSLLSKHDPGSGW
jgi:hypothetical protein